MTRLEVREFLKHVYTFDIGSCWDAAHDCYSLELYYDYEWTARTEDEYNDKDDTIDSRCKDYKHFIIRHWFDISGFDYWKKERNYPNYVAGSIYLLKDLYNKREVQRIINYIDKSIELFNKIL